MADFIDNIKETQTKLDINKIRPVGDIKRDVKNGTITPQEALNEHEGVMKAAFNAADGNFQDFGEGNVTKRALQGTLLGKSYFWTDSNGLTLPNYAVTLEWFNEVDNTPDLKSLMADVRVGRFDETFIFQTDSIVGGKGDNIVSTLDADGNSWAFLSTFQKTRNIKFNIDTQYGTEYTQIALRDNATSLSSYELLASNANQHSRAMRLRKNSRILNLATTTGTQTLATIGFDFANPDQAAYAALGESVYNLMRNQVLFYEEIMDEIRPGGYMKEQIGLYISPLLDKAINAYQATGFTSSDKAFETAAKGLVYKYILYGVPVFVTNNLTGGNYLAPNGKEIFSNSDNIEMITLIKGNIKWGEVPNKFKSDRPVAGLANTNGIQGNFGIQLDNSRIQYMEAADNGVLVRPELAGHVIVNRTNYARDTIFTAVYAASNTAVTASHLIGTYSFHVVEYSTQEVLFTEEAVWTSSESSTTVNIAGAIPVDVPVYVRMVKQNGTGIASQNSGTIKASLAIEGVTQPPNGLLKSGKAKRKSIHEIKIAPDKDGKVVTTTKFNAGIQKR